MRMVSIKMFEYIENERKPSLSLKIKQNLTLFKRLGSLKLNRTFSYSKKYNIIFFKKTPTKLSLL